MVSTQNASPKSLFANRQFLLLWWGQTISLFGDIVFDMTLVIWIATIIGKDQTWAPLAVSGVLTAAMVPVFCVGPLAGVFVDRWDKRKVLLWTDIIRVVLILALFFIIGVLPMILPASLLSISAQLVAVYVVVFLVSTCSQFFAPARLVIISELVEQERQAQASSMEQVTQSLAAILGPLIATPLLVLFGLQIALLVNVFSFAISFFAILAIRVPQSVQEESEGVATEKPNILSEFWQGLRFAFQHQLLRALIIASFITMLGGGAFNTLHVFFFTQNLQAPVIMLGVANAIAGVGIVGGAIIAGMIAERLGLERILFGALILAGLVLVILARVTNLWLAFAFMFGLGLAQAGISVVTWPLVLKVTPSELLGRVASILAPLATLGSLLATALVGYLTSTILVGWQTNIMSVHFGPIDTIFLCAGLLILLSGFYLLLCVRSMRQKKSIQQPEEEVVLNV